LSSDNGIPTSGDFAEGDFVFNDDPSPIVSGGNGLKSVTLGWSRIVDGSLHVDGTDWQTVYGMQWDGVVYHAADTFTAESSGTFKGTHARVGAHGAGSANGTASLELIRGTTYDAYGDWRWFDTGGILYLNAWDSGAISTMATVVKDTSWAIHYPLTVTGGITGSLTGTASLATALAANGANCSAGSYPLGVDASGAAESCGTSISGNAATVTTNANLTGGVTSVGNAATVVTNANLTGPITSVGNATTIVGPVPTYAVNLSTVTTALSRKPEVLFSWVGSSTTNGVQSEIIGAQFTVPTTAMINVGDYIDIFCIAKSTTISFSKQLVVEVEGDKDSTGTSTNVARQWTNKSRVMRTTSTNLMHHAERERGDPAGAQGQSVDIDYTNTVNAGVAFAVRCLIKSDAAAPATTAAGDEVMDLKGMSVVYYPAP